MSMPLTGSLPAGAPMVQPQPQQPAAPQIQQGQPSYSFPATQIPPAPQAPPQQGQPPVQQGQPAPGFGQPPQGFTTPPLQAQQPAQGPVPLNTVIQAGQGVPRELVGKTLGEALQYYAVLRDEYFRGKNPAQQPQQQPAAQGQQPQQPQQPSGTNFWTDPVGAIQRVVKEQLGQMTLPQTINSIEQQMAGLPHYQQIRPLIAEKLQGFSPDQLANPALWQSAYDLTIGELTRQGRLPQAAQQPTQSQPQHNGYVRLPVPSGQQLQSGLPWTPAFTEVPNAGAIPQMRALSPEQDSVRQKMGMTVEQYIAWSGGIQP